MHEVLVNRLGGLSLPRKSVVRLTDRSDMTLDVYRGRKTTMQHVVSMQIIFSLLLFAKRIILIYDAVCLTHFILTTPEGVFAKSADPDQMIRVSTILLFVQTFSNKNILINIS